VQIIKWLAFNSSMLLKATFIYIDLRKNLISTLLQFPTLYSFYRLPPYSHLYVKSEIILIKLCHEFSPVRVTSV